MNITNIQKQKYVYTHVSVHSAEIKNNQIAIAIIDIISSTHYKRTCSDIQNCENVKHANVKSFIKEK